MKVSGPGYDHAVRLSELVGKPCFPIVFGCSHLVLVRSLLSRAKAEVAAFGLLDAALAVGINVFDTAAIYGAGASETALGKWIERTGVRDRVVIATKGGHPALTTRPRISRKDVAADFQDSLARLRTDFIDVYLIHHDNPAMPPGEIMDICADALDHKRYGLLGVSNWTHERIAAANVHARRRGLRPIAVSSPQFSLTRWRQPFFPNLVSVAGEVGAPARTWYREQGMPVFAWSGLSHGFLSGRYPLRSKLDGRMLSASALLCLFTYGTPENYSRLERAKELAARKSVSLPQLAIAYILTSEFPVLPVVGTRSGASLHSNVDALSVTLNSDERRWLEIGDTGS